MKHLKHKPSLLRRLSLEPLEKRSLLAVFTVDVSSDEPSQPGTTLREAVALANSTSGADTIVFSPSAFPNGPGTVTTTIALRFGPGGGQLSLTDVAGVTIQGFADPGRVQVSGADMSRVFRATTGMLNLRNLTLANGAGTQSAFGFGGGAIAVEGSAGLNATDCEFLNNTGVSSSGNAVGGAILAGSGNVGLAFTRCLFAGNTTTGGRGAAIGLVGGAALSLTDCRFEANGDADTEGVIEVENSNRPITITGSTFAGSVSSAIQLFLNGGGLTIRDSTFEGGMDLGPANGARAAVLVNGIGGSVTVDLTNVTVSGNGYSGVRTNSATTTLTHCTIVDNHSLTTSAGGVVTPTTTPATTLKNSIVVGNTRTVSIGGTPTALGGDIYRINLTNTNATGSNNVVGDPQSAGGLQEGTNANRVGTGASPNAVLPLASVVGPLSDQGGAVRTHALRVTGRAYNAGSAANAAGIAYDARGSLFDRAANGFPDAGAYEVQTITPPRVSEAVFDVDGVNAPGFPHRLELRFETPIDGSTLRNFDLELTNTTTGEIVPVPSIRVDYEPVSSRATFVFPGFVHAVLPDGNYHATLPAGSVADAVGTVQTEAFSIDFTVLAGDANRDFTVGFQDLVRLAQNYNTSGHIFSEGNFDYDPEGRVDFADLVLLAQRYNTTLATTASITAAFRPIPAGVVDGAKDRTRRTSVANGVLA